MRQNNVCGQVVATAEAATALQEMQDGFDAAFNDKTREPHDRALASIIAVGCLPAVATAPVIEEVHVRWAVSFVSYCVEGLGIGETRQVAEMKKYVREYIGLPPARRRAYGVSQLANTAGRIGTNYLRRRAARCAAFTQDQRGFNAALDTTLAALCKSGWLYKLSPIEVSNKFGARMGDVYAVGNRDNWD